MKSIMSILTILVLTVTFSASGQNLPTLKPTLAKANEYTKNEQLAWQKALDMYSKINSGEIEYERLSAADKKMADSLEVGSGPITQGVGCSWYCGGGPYKITASSNLKEEGKITYLPNYCIHSEEREDLVLQILL